VDEITIAHAHERLEEERARYNAGDMAALFGALRVCANHDLVMPEWVSRAFIRGYDKVLTCRAGSWDEAFGAPYPKGFHLVGTRKRPGARDRRGHRATLGGDQALAGGARAQESERREMTNTKPAKGRANLQEAFDAGFDAVKAYIDSALGDFEKRLAALEAHPFKYLGAWESSKAYGKNTLVTLDGCIWIAREDTVQRPGDGSNSWTLAVKKGRDGKDAR
jgi:hypothetical protein